MRYYPINLDIRDKRCVVIGGGRVAQRKVEHLLAAGALVTVIAPVLTAHLEELAEEGHITMHLREYQTGDLDDAFLAFIATDVPSVNEDVVHEAHAKNILINVGDMPAYCDFTVPARIQRGEVLVTISTAGASPALAADLRRQIEEVIGEEYGPLAEILRALREPVLERLPDSDARKAVFETLVQSGLRECVRRRDAAGVDAILAEILGADVTLNSLGVDL